MTAASSDDPPKPPPRARDGLLRREDFTPERLEWYARELAKHGQSHGVMAPEEREATRQAILAKLAHGDDIWVFGYGSLMWNPAIEIAESRVATLKGYHRAFCLGLWLGRASPETPGLMLALDTGGDCVGVAHRVEAGKADSETGILWMREMLSGAYHPAWVEVEIDGVAIPAITFIINREHRRFIDGLDMEEKARRIASAKGLLGANRDYLYRCWHELRKLGVDDPYVDALFKRVTELTGESGDPLPQGGL